MALPYEWMHRHRQFDFDPKTSAFLMQCWRASATCFVVNDRGRRYGSVDALQTLYIRIVDFISGVDRAAELSCKGPAKLMLPLIHRV